MSDNGPDTLIEAVRYFSDAETCHQYMLTIKWPDGRIVCPKCESDRIGQIKTRRLLRCKACRKQSSTKVGTIFEDSPLGLDKWFVAVWCIANAKNGISSCELGRALDIQQKTAWFMLHRVRLAMRARTFRKLNGTVESDETYVGGKAENMHAAQRARRILGRGGVGKQIVHGLLERGNAERCSQVNAEVIPTADANTIQERFVGGVERGATVYTDAAASYSNLYLQYVHEAIDHATTYVRGFVHTNGLENFWTLLKRAIRGTYVAVAPFHLQRYIDGQVWRYNNRRMNDGARFNLVMQGVLGKRITFRELCAIDDAGFMGIR